MATRTSELLPPRLSMDAYVDFVEESFRSRDSKQARRQKELEEHITKRFSYTPEPDVAWASRP